MGKQLWAWCTGVCSEQVEMHWKTYIVEQYRGLPKCIYFDRVLVNCLFSVRTLF